MHLMVLGASRPGILRIGRPPSVGLNAPDGAGCFPTKQAVCVDVKEECLNAPDGAGCFPTHFRELRDYIPLVSMHLMVLGASRLWKERIMSTVWLSLNAPDGAGCFPTERKASCTRTLLRSQCT